MQTEITHYQPTSQMTPSIAVIPTQQDKESWTMKEKVLFSLLGVVVVSGVIYIGRKIILNKIANQEENKSFDDGSSAMYAKQIKMAFENDGWPGTNTTALRTSLREIPSRQDFANIVKSYQKLYNSNLLKDMSDELQSTEYNEMLQIIAAKPEKKGQALSTEIYTAWAKRMKAAFDKSYGFLPGTDSDAIIAVFNEIPTQTAFIKVTVEYKKLYGTNMLEDLKSEGEFGQYEDWMKIIIAKAK